MYKDTKSEKSIFTNPKIAKLAAALLIAREEKDLINTYDLGVNAYVVKPVGFQQFIEAVKQIGGF